jgi:trk system potassium uptake protein TrkA
MYIIIIGCGRLGSSLAKRLSDEGNDICVIDRDGDKLISLGSGFNGLRIKGVEYDSDKLLEAGIKQADGLLAVTPDDNINITVSLIGAKIFTVPKIIARVNHPGKKIIYKQLGIDTINPIQYETEIIKNKLFLDNIDVVSPLDNNYQIIEILINKVKSVTVDTIEEKYNCIISSVLRNEEIRLPEKNQLLQWGDRIICTVGNKDRGRLISSLNKEILI